jgi:hypothetical protein
LEKNKENNSFKKFRKVFLRTIAVLLLLLLILSIALSTPYVQTKIAQYATEKINEDFGTDINVDEVAITVFGGVKLKKVFIRDHHKDTLIYADRIKTNVLGMKNLIDGKLLFGDLVADGFFLNIKNYKNEPHTNLDLFIEAFDDGKPSSGKFLLTAKQLQLRNSRFAMYDFNRENPKDVDFTKLNAIVKNFKVEGPNVYAAIKKMSFKDHRGLFVNNLTSDFTYTKTNIKLENLIVETKESFLKGKTILSYDRKDFSNFNNKVVFDVELDSSNLATNDIRYFYSELGKNRTFELKTKVTGTLNDFYASNLDLKDNRNSIIRGDVNFKNLFPRSPGEFYMNGDFKKITSNYDDLTTLLPNILGKKLPTTLKKLGQFQFTGKTEVTQKFINADFVMNTALGLIESDLHMENIDNIDNAKYKGNVILDNFDVGTILNQKDVGRVTMNIDVDGKGFTQKLLNTTFVGDVNRIAFNGYTYKNIIVDGYFKQPIFSGKVFVNDPNLYMDFDGNINLSKREKVVDFNAKIDFANLEKLRILKDSVAVFKGEINIQAVGNNLDNFKGDVTLTDASYQNKKDLYFVDYLNINSSFDGNNERTIVVTSPDAVEGKIVGKYEFSQLPKMVQNSLGSLYTNYIPNKVKKGQYLNFDFDIYSKVVEIFFPEISLATNTKVKGNISSDSDDFKLDFTSPQIIAYENTFDNLLLQIDNRNPLYKSYIQLDSIKTKYYKIRDFSLINTMVNDTLNFRTEFRGGNHGNDFYNLNVYHTINKENKNVVGFDKSEVQFKEYLWYINEDETEDNKIVFDKKMENFSFENITGSHEGEKINLNGLLSGNSKKDLKLTFENVNLNKVTPDIDKFKFDGKLNGIVDFKQDGAIFQPTSSLLIEDLFVNNIALGNLNLDIKGDESLQKFFLSSSIENKNVEAFNADGSLEISDGKTFLDIDLKFDKFDLGILGKIGGDVISNIRGFASGNARIDGNVNELDYNGRLFINEAGMTIPYLNVDYLFDDRSIVDVTENKFIIRETNITDTKFNTSGSISGFIKHKQFGDWELDLGIDTKRLLALNTVDHEDAAYFGTAFMNGSATIKGRTEALVISVNAESEEGTDIKIPINDSYASEENGFIRFKTAEEAKGEKLREDRNYGGLELKFNFDILENADIEVILNRDSGHGMKGNGRGTLFFEINTLGKFNMYGDFQVYEGYYNFKYGGLIDKRFDVKKYGSIVWSGDPMAATLNLEAVYKVVGGANPGVLIDNPSFNRKVDVDVIIGIKGNLANPEPDFNIEFPNVASTLRSELQYKLDDRDTRQTQALSLLTSNSFLSSEGLSQSQPTNLLFEKARSLFADIFATSDGKLTIAPDYVGADNRPGFETDGRFGLTLSSQINDRITINGKVGVPVGSSVNESAAVVGDVELQYRVNDDGSLNLRVFNRENDVTYIGQGVGYTQGLGISYEVDFDTFRELVAKMFKNKKLKAALPSKTEIEDSYMPDNIRFNPPPKQEKKEPTPSNSNSNKEAIPNDD